MAKDKDLPGMTGEGVERPSIKAVDEAFEELINAREKRMSWGEKEGTASATLVSLFHKHNLKSYVFEEKRYKLAAIEKVKVARDEEPAAAEAEE